MTEDEIIKKFDAHVDEQLKAYRDERKQTLGELSSVLNIAILACALVAIATFALVFL